MDMYEASGHEMATPHDIARHVDPNMGLKYVFCVICLNMALIFGQWCAVRPFHDF